MLKGAQRIVFDELRRCTQPVEVTFGRLAQRTGYHHVTIRRAVDALSASGLVAVSYAARPGCYVVQVYDER